MKTLLASKITKCDLLVIPFYEGKKPSSAQSEALSNEFHHDFEGKLNETVLLYQKNKITPRILLVGLGKQEEANAEHWRCAGGTAAKYIKKGMLMATVLPPKESVELLAAFSEGFWLGSYQFDAFIHDAEHKKHRAESLTLVVQQRSLQEPMMEALREMEVVVQAVDEVRDLVTMPSNGMHPRTMGEKAKSIARHGSKLSTKIFDQSKLKKMGMGCLLGVGAGAKEEPVLIVMEYKNKPLNKKPLVLVGKGICFDSGGINLKTQSLEEMKYDMAGAASVLGVMEILGKLKPRLHVIGIAACAENMPSGTATKPGDVLTAYDGTTVEVTNTDAEGRLVLGDAIAYAVKTYEPQAIITIATLTGAAAIALGYDITALVTNHHDTARAVKEAGKSVHEKLWELPCESAYKKHLKSPIADLNNHNPVASASTIMGALFLEHFTKKTPWVHLDIASTAWTKDDKPYTPKGATGRPVRTLWKFLKEYQVGA